MTNMQDKINSKNICSTNLADLCRLVICVTSHLMSIGYK